jgi:hypothetical protein
VVWSEACGQPFIQWWEEFSFGEVNVSRVLDLVRQPVLGGESASVVQRLLALLSLHSAVTETAVQKAAEYVAVLGGVALTVLASGTVRGQHILGPLEGLGINQGFVDG